MNFETTWIFKDSKETYKRSRWEIVANDLTDLATKVGQIATALNAVTDLALVSVETKVQLTGVGFAGESVSNVDTGATFRCLLETTDETVKHGIFRVPGFKASLVDLERVVKLTEAEVAAFLAFLTAGDILISDGEIVSAVISGRWDK